MTFKVNYGFQKAERDRAKQAKKEAKRREKEEAAAQERGGAPGPGEIPRDEVSAGEETPS